jgi:hypothetical protein
MIHIHIELTPAIKVLHIFVIILLIFDISNLPVERREKPLSFHGYYKVIIWAFNVKERNIGEFFMWHQKSITG